MTGGLRKLNFYLLAAVGVAALTSASSTPAKAQDMQSLQSQISSMQAAIKDLQRQVASAQAQAAAAKSAAASSGGGGGSDLDLKVKWRGAPEFSSSDGKFKMKIRGRLMTDYNGIDQDEPITGEGDISAVELRRARLGVEGVVFYDWKYKFEVDFAANEVAIKDAYVAYANWVNFAELSEVRLGNQYVYTSLEQTTSSRFITFLERAAFTEAFLPSVDADRQIGGAILLGDKHWSLQTGYYGASVGEGNDVPGQEEFDTDKTAVSVRGTIAPLNREVNGTNQVVHLGASYRHREAGTLNCGTTVCDIGEDDEVNALFQYRARGADLHLADRFVDTPQFAKADDMFVLEAALVLGSFSMQGEYVETTVDGIDPLANVGVATRVNPTYKGYYVDASWFITGETRNYESDEGIFGRTKVKNPVFGGNRGWGAWQIAGRYDVIDLSNKSAAMAFAYDCSECGEQETWLIGLNWWLTDYTALKFQVSQSEIKGPLGDSNENRGAEITGFGARAQVDW
jgi:phosphate-selective porin OprO/OprP